MAQVLQERGYDARAIVGGLQAWMDAGLPVTDLEPPLAENPAARDRLKTAA